MKHTEYFAVVGEGLAYGLDMRDLWKGIHEMCRVAKMPMDIRINNPEGSDYFILYNGYYYTFIN